MSANWRNEELEREYAKMVHQDKSEADRLGMKGAYNPKNVFPGSPWMPTRFPKPEEVREEVRAISEKVLMDWRVLKEIVERHSELIRKRWVKKTRKQMKDMLLKAWASDSSAPRFPPLFSTI